MGKNIETAIKRNLWGLLGLTGFLLLLSQGSWAQENACTTPEFQKLEHRLLRRAKFASEFSAEYAREELELASSYKTISLGAGLQKASLGLSESAITAILFIEGGSAAKAALTKQTSGLWALAKKIFLAQRTAASHAVAPFLFGLAGGPKDLGQGLGEAFYGDPLDQNLLTLTPITLKGKEGLLNLATLSESIASDLNTLSETHRSIERTRVAQFPDLTGWTTYFRLGLQKEAIQTLYISASQHRQAYQFEEHYALGILRRMRSLCSTGMDPDAERIALRQAREKAAGQKPEPLPAALYWTQMYSSKNEWHHYPAWFKKKVDRYVSQSLEQMPEVAREAKARKWKLPGTIGELISALGDAMVISKNPTLIARANRTIDRLRPFAADTEMRDCYHARVLDADLVNAFNIGCTIYVTSSLMNQLDDEELAGALAHEMAHGDMGHAVRNLGLEWDSFKTNVKDVLFAELDRIGGTGSPTDILSRMNQVDGFSNRMMVQFENFLHHYSKQAPVIELEADMGGALILDRSGIGRQALRKALVKLTHFEEDDTTAPQDKEGVRNYPSTRVRLDAIDLVR